MDKDYTIQEIFCYANLNQMLIDNTLTQAKINGTSELEVKKANYRLQKLNAQKQKIMDIVEKKINEEFSE